MEQTARKGYDERERERALREHEREHERHGREQRKRPNRPILIAVAAVFGALAGLLIIASLFLAVGGAKTILEPSLSSALNGYMTVDVATYSPIGRFHAHDLSMILDWEGRQEEVISVEEVQTWPQVLQLLSGRMQFGTTTIRNLHLNLRMLSDGMVNIEKLFVRNEQAEPSIRVMPPRHIELDNAYLTFAPYTYSPVKFENIKVSFFPASPERLQVVGYGSLYSKLIGGAGIMVYLDLRNRVYLIVYEGGYHELSSETMELLPLPPDIELHRKIVPGGRVRFSALVAYRNQVQESIKIGVELAGVDISSLQMPVSLTGVVGTITTNTKEATLENFMATIPLLGEHASLQGSGRIHEDGSQTFEASATGLTVSDSILAYLPGGKLVTQNVSMAGEVKLNASLHNRKGWILPRAWADVAFRGELAAQVLPVPVHNVVGTIRTDERGVIVIDKVAAEIGAETARSPVSVGGTFDFNSQSGDIFFSSPGLLVTNDLLSCVPQLPPELLSLFHIRGYAILDGEFIYTRERPVIVAQARLEGMSAAYVKFPEVAVNNVTGDMHYAHERLILDNVQGNFLLGDLSVTLRLNLAPNDRSFAGDLHAQGVNLDRLPRELTQRDIAGQLQADIYFEGVEPSLPALKLRGQAKITNGRLAELPLLVSIINFLNLSLPGRVVFSSATAGFRIEDQVAHIERVELYSDVLDVFIRGTVDFDGNLDLQAGVGYRRPVLRNIPLIGPVLSYITNTLRRALTTVRVTGNVESPSINLVSVQYLSSPIKALASFFESNSSVGK